jgi:hypothetical protein
MTALTLRRSDPIRNMHRYYRLDVQLDLFVCSGPGASSASGAASGRPDRPALSPTPPHVRRRRRLSASGGQRNGGGMHERTMIIVRSAQVSAVSGVPSYAPRPC